MTEAIKIGFFIFGLEETIKNDPRWQTFPSTYAESLELAKTISASIVAGCNILCLIPAIEEEEQIMFPETSCLAVEHDDKVPTPILP